MQKRALAASLAIAFSVSGVGFVAPASAGWTGKASYYNLKSRTASGGRVGHMTAAHRTLPFGSKVRVTNLSNRRSVVVVVNDRGPFVGGRIIDVSQGAAHALGMVKSGVARVRVDRIS
jgi:rare lipoprotein A